MYKRLTMSKNENQTYVSGLELSNKIIELLSEEYPDLSVNGLQFNAILMASQVTDMSFLFCNLNNSYYPECTFKDPIYSISNWNTENVTDMQWLCRSSSYNQLLNNWDVSNVTDMMGMSMNPSYNQPLNNWDVSNVTDMM